MGSVGLREVAQQGLAPRLDHAAVEARKAHASRRALVSPERHLEQVEE